MIYSGDGLGGGFGENHKLLRAYDRLACSAKFNQLNFESVEQADAEAANDNTQAA